MSNFAKISSTVRESYEAAFPNHTIRPDSDFFELGGDSLSMHTIMSELEQNLGVEIQGLDILHAPTVEQLSQRISKLSGNS